MCKNAQMDWDDLRYVLSISRTGTLSGAAEALGVTHTTVGRRLRAFEEQLSAQLFDRTPNGLVPTAAGQDLVEVAEQVEQSVLLAEGRVLGRDAQLRGRLRVSTVDFLFTGFTEAFLSFTTRYPRIELTVASTRRDVSLSRREADVALRLSNSPPEALVGRKVGRVGFAAYASRALARRIGPNASHEAYPWIGLDEEIAARTIGKWMERHAPRATVSIRLDGSALMLRHAIAAGVGVHFLPCIDAEPDRRLTRVGPIDPDFGRDLWLLTLPELRHNSRVRAFMDHMAEALRRELVGPRKRSG